jgi:hypothetical protein
MWVASNYFHNFTIKIIFMLYKMIPSKNRGRPDLSLIKIHHNKSILIRKMSRFFSSLSDPLNNKVYIFITIMLEEIITFYRTI